MKIGDLTEEVRNEVDERKKEIAKDLIRCKLEEIKRVESILDGLKSENKIISIKERNTDDIIHKLTHQKLHIKFWEIMIEDEIEGGIDLKKIKSFPFPIVIFNFIEQIL